jgi:hypothetical protein
MRLSIINTIYISDVCRFWEIKQILLSLSYYIKIIFLDTLKK